MMRVNGVVLRLMMTFGLLLAARLHSGTRVKRRRIAW